MKRDEFEKQRECLYREILKNLNLISSHATIQAASRPREACLTLLALYKDYNNLVDEYIPRN